MRKVSRHVLVPSGSTFTTKDSDFVVSDNLDFHPTDVIEDADGSLLILDTGGWYKLCCPTSQLVKPDVLGAIYRVRKTGAHKVDDPWGKKIAWWNLDAAGFLKLFDDSRPAVQRKAIEEATKKAVRAQQTSPGRANEVRGRYIGEFWRSHSRERIIRTGQAERRLVRNTCAGWANPANPGGRPKRGSPESGTSRPGVPH